MIGEFSTTERSDIVLVHAVKRARSRNQEPNSLDVVFGLAEEESGVASYVLKEADIYGDSVPESPTLEPIYPVLEEARRISQILDNNRIGTEHLLLSIVSQPKSEAYNWFLSINRSPDRIESHIMELLGNPAYTQSYLPNNQFWISHWRKWVNEDVNLYNIEWAENFVKSEPVLFSVRHPVKPFGVVFQEAKDNNNTDYREVDGVQCIVTKCFNKNVSLVRMLVVGYILSRLVF